MNRLFFAAGLFTIAASQSSHGQTAIAEAKIPFDFHLGPTLMSAGNYIVSESQSLLIVRSEAGKPAAMLLTLPASRCGKSSSPSLQFERYGNDYFLVNIWHPNSQEGRALPKSKQERELARRAGFRKTEHVALRTTNHPDRDGR